MDPDFRPAKRPAGSLRKSLDTRQAAETPTPPTESFKTPEEIAAADAGLGKLDLSLDDQPKPAAKSKGIWANLHIRWPFGNREWLVSGLLVVLLAFGASYLITHSSSGKTSAVSVIKHKPKPAAPKTVPSTLTGLQVDPSVNQRPVTGVMIENSLDARPQSGLADAGVVFEAIAEGGITRFLALYQDTAPDNLGPVRSARPYYVQWALGFDAGYAHVGGSPEALADIKAWGARDLDQFFNSSAYHRVSSRAAPHNVYTSIANLNQLEAGKGWTTSNYKGFVRIVPLPSGKMPPKPAGSPTAKTIDFATSGPLYNSHFDYDAASNTYKRSEGGAAHIDANGNRQISPTVVIGMVIPYSLESDGYHSDYQVIGSGAAYIFQDGMVYTGSWSKTGASDQITFTDSSGQPIKLEPGQTWLTALSDASKIKYSP